MGGGGKRGGVGGRGSKSHNFKECKNANKRRNEKFERENQKEQNIARQKHEAQQNAYYAPTDKADEKNLKKVQGKNDKMVEKARLKAEKQALKDADE